jgi:hypothetical protein
MEVRKTLKRHGDDAASSVRVHHPQIHQQKVVADQQARRPHDVSVSTTYESGIILP